MAGVDRRVKVIRPGEGRTVSVVGDTYRFLAQGGDTAGTYFLTETEVAPGGGPPLHYHTREEEGFYVLEGEFEFEADGEVVPAGPGTFVHLPKNSRHGFRNLGDAPGRLLCLCAPAGIEAFFAAADGQGPERVIELAARHGVQIIPPG